eukprot:7984-Heterococcus_DN1.PRE.3
MSGTSDWYKVMHGISTCKELQLTAVKVPAAAASLPVCNKCSSSFSNDHTTTTTAINSVHSTTASDLLNMTMRTNTEYMHL